MMWNLGNLVRNGLAGIKAYSTARNEFKGEASIFLDANENPFNAEFSRYPDPLQKELRSTLAKLRHTSYENIFCGHGSDEIIDLLIRLFCEPRQDNIISLSPSYGMYEVSARINIVNHQKVKLNADFQLSTQTLMEKINRDTKLIFLCSPNNPNGGSIPKSQIQKIAANFNGLLVIDEAYIDFSDQNSCTDLLALTPNLIILQTLSKAWAMAGIRIGFAICSPEIIRLLDQIKPPYNIGLADAQIANKTLQQPEQKNTEVQEIIKQRDHLTEKLNLLKAVVKVFPSDANFLLVRFKNAQKAYQSLASQGIIVRDRSHLHQCENCLRITIGQKEENNRLLEILQKL